MSFYTLAADHNRKPVYIVKLGFDNPISADGVEHHIKGKACIDQQAWQSIENIDFSPINMVPGGLGRLGSISITFNDFSVLGQEGTYFNRLLGSNPFYLDRKLTLYVGFYSEPFDWANFRERVYYIKRVTGPTSKGRVTVTAQDVLTKLEKDEAVVPLKTTGELQTTINETFTGQVNIYNNENFDASGGVASLDGSEWVRYSGTVGLSDIVITERNVFGTEASEHDAGVPVRHVFTFEDENCVDLIRRLIKDHSPIDNSYINDTDWDTERDTYLSSELMTGGWAEPKPIKTAISEICEQVLASVWSDDEAQEIKIKAIGPTLEAIQKINDEEHILDEGEVPKRDPSKAITRVWVWFNKFNHSDGDDQENFIESDLFIEPDLEGAEGHNAVKEEVIYASYIPASGAATVSKIANRILAQQGLGEFEHTFRVDIKDSNFKVGNIVEITSKLIPNENGTPAPTNFLVTERDIYNDNVYQYKALIAGIEAGSKFGAFAPDSIGDYATETAVNREQYCFFCGDNDEMPNGDDPYLWL